MPLVFWHFTTPADQLVDRRWLALTRTWAFIFLAWWLVTLARSVFFSDIPLLHAALFGRDFLYFALLLPLLPVALRRRSDFVALVAMVGVGGSDLLRRANDDVTLSVGCRRRRSLGADQSDD